MAAERDREVQTLTERLHEAETSSQIVSRSRDISEEKYAKAKVLPLLQAGGVNIEFCSIRFECARSGLPSMEDLTNGWKAVFNFSEGLRTYYQSSISSLLMLKSRRN